MTEIILKDIVKRFGNLVAVNNLNLDIKDKDSLLIMRVVSLFPILVLILSVLIV